MTAATVDLTAALVRSLKVATRPTEAELADPNYGAMSPEDPRFNDTVEALTQVLRHEGVTDRREAERQARAWALAPASPSERQVAREWRDKTGQFSPDIIRQKHDQVIARGEQRLREMDTRTVRERTMNATAAKAERQEQDRRPRTLRLYDALEALDILDELIDEHGETIEIHGGDIESVPAIAELLAFAEDQLQTVVERWGLKIRSLLAEAQGAQLELDRLQGIVNRKTNAAKRLKDFLKRQLEAREIRKITTALVTVRVQANGQPSVRAISEGLIEDLYAQGSEFIKRKETFDLDREKILAAKENGEVLPDGILVEKGSHLRVE